MNSALVSEIFAHLDELPIVDIHTHINWRRGAARNIGEILSYHYYTELLNSAEYQEGKLPLDDPEELTRVLFRGLDLIRNTVQYDWLMAIGREFLGLDPSAWQPERWREVFNLSVEVMEQPDWSERVLEQANIIRIYLTNSYDEDLAGLDNSLYTPCLRVEPFITGIEQPAERERMGAYLGQAIEQPGDVIAALDITLDAFSEYNLAYVAASTAPNVRTFPVKEEDAGRLITRLNEGSEWNADDRAAWQAYALARIAEACRARDLPFHLMVGVNRGVYQQGVPSGTDLLDSTSSLRGYDWLFNSFPEVRFPVAVLADTAGLELASAGWIRHNVYPSGHWWFANQPVEIARELRRRLDVVPAGKLIGYFSDAYYLEFILPKFRMYKFELAQALAERMERSLMHPNSDPFTLDDALELGGSLLIDNPLSIVGTSDTAAVID
ncbi:MAG: hypothetical protein LLG44_04345 [Chloroflexi bacterium]|nr:hypothetical protein [Chloroflexota bacterium]